MKNILFNYISKSISNPDLNERILDIERIRGQRPVRSNKCKVLQLENMQIFPEGSIVAMIGRKDDFLFNEMIESIKNNDGNALARVNLELDRIANKFPKELEDLIEGEQSGNTKEVENIDLPTLSEVRYNEKSLVSYITITKEFPISFQLFAYNGGRLENDMFELVEYYDIENDERLDSFVVINSPTISSLERSALELVPLNSSEINISSAVIGWVPIAVAVAMAIARVGANKLAQKAGEAALAAAVAWAVTKVLDRVALKDATIGKMGIVNTDANRELLKSLKPESTAQQLLEMRRKLLLANFL